ncbi:ferredoxin [Sphingorhabdus sp.]|jgi:ferredoxin|uniref:ferredoxin n=1 Tax=Sphingorhabdus sp. TaxID=1902408 RepID=UPI002608DDF4|nr:ferredoxin [Sphingorhabdus sp.]MDH4398788.1 ferredoxin [Sphingorhabdus sp.]
MSNQDKFKVVINKPACCGYGVCAEICPDVYKLDENGMVYVEDEFVPCGMEELAKEGADACPQSALKLVAV